MDFFDLLLQAGLITTAIVIYLIVFRKSSTRKGFYRVKGWNYPLKLLCARYGIKRWKAQQIKLKLEEPPLEWLTDGWDCISFRASSSDSTTVVLAIRKLCGRLPMVEVTVHVKLSDGTTYRLHRHPDTAIGAWTSIENGWSADGLKVQILVPNTRIRILFNGLLTRGGDNVTQHVKFNFIWSSASYPVRYPDDWSDELAARALALEPWRDGKWPYMLGKWEDGSWLQWGAIQGRFQSFDSTGTVDKSEYMRVRGVKERSWSPHGYQGLRRSVTVTVAARDGIAVQLRALSYHKVLTKIVYGCVRFPDCTEKNITWTDFNMSDFCESPAVIPNVYTINVTTKAKTVKLVLRINSDGGTLFSGLPYQQEFVYRMVTATVNGELATGVLELGYEPSVITEPSYPLSHAPLFRWLSELDAGEVGYCLPLSARAAACPAYVGGKGASLALLTSVQRDEGYRVPPGYCLTIRALERQLEANPELKAAISDIETAGEKYDEKNFKEKCSKAVELFEATEITEDVREEVLFYLNELRSEALHQRLGPDLRFAVRSSAVGEDSEALSAAGQNETILGCASDVDVLRGVKKCWGSMFAFTSAYYRRQNGQPCLCGGGIVVQALVGARAAGVMFTRHPDAGDPSRLLITANYGLGESVVSGSVEPDTIEVTRDINGYLTISKIELGSKSERVITTSEGVGTEEVPHGDRQIPCLTESEALRLAQLGAAQEELWGAGRDVEWAITKDAIFLLQARPITSLERWTEEELLHELDFPIMADDELISFANVGEVLPKPISSLTYDLLIRPLSIAVGSLVGTDEKGYERTLEVTHNRLFIPSYNVVYARVPYKLDLNLRMVEMAVHGHKVAGDNVLRVALARRSPRWTTKLQLLATMTMALLVAKRRQRDAVKKANNLKIHELDVYDISKLLDAISEVVETVAEMCNYHSVTTLANNGIQMIAMAVLLEGDSDFTPEQCNEISALLASGDVLSAEVPLGIARISRELEHSGLVADFRALHPTDAMDWLKEHLPKIHNDVCMFLQRHGHRAVMEFDLATKPWDLCPENLMKVLQNMRPSKEDTQKTKSDAEIVNSLKTPKKTSTRKILRWLLPLCRNTVRYRETTKAYLILTIHKQRLALRNLADLMLKQWYLPDAELIFYFRLHELRDYIRSRDPVLLKKATQRLHDYSKWSKLRFEEISTGWPEPIKSSGAPVITGDLNIKATSVCGGEVIARACVVKDLSEIGELRRGDVLITHATDIGWSPYFPLLAGIVTELGGLISHGAVIAREYGLPAVVGATGATDAFRTGDRVRLSGTAGTLERLQVADTQTNDDETTV